jgi:hypothetical protein
MFIADSFSEFELNKKDCHLSDSLSMINELLPLDLEGIIFQRL